MNLKIFILVNIKLIDILLPKSNYDVCCSPKLIQRSYTCINLICSIYILSYLTPQCAWLYQEFFKKYINEITRKTYLKITPPPKKNNNNNQKNPRGRGVSLHLYR